MEDVLKINGINIKLEIGKIYYALFKTGNVEIFFKLSKIEKSKKIITYLRGECDIAFIFNRNNTTIKLINSLYQNGAVVNINDVVYVELLEKTIDVNTFSEISKMINKTLRKFKVDSIIN